MEKEKMENPIPSVCSNELMDYFEEQILKYNFRPDDMDKILNGLWVERTTCTVRRHLTFDDVRGSRIIHYGVVDAFYELFKLMKENDLAIKDLECYPYCYESAYPNPIIDFKVRTYEHEYRYYPVMLYDQCDSDNDEYMHIKNETARLRAVYCDSTHKPEENC